MGSVFSAIEKRQSCRDFSPMPVEEEKLMRCMEAARLAPSACNSQPWKIVLVNDSQRTGQVAKAVQDGGMNRFADSCPVFAVLVESAQNITAKVGGTIKNQQYAGIDIGIAAAHFTLCATEEGLASCILGWFNERKLKMLLNIPKTRRIRLVVALGYPSPSDEQRVKVRKPMEELMSFNKY